MKLIKTFYDIIIRYCLYNKQNNINFNKNNSTNNIFRDSRLISKQKTDYDTSNSATNRKMN